MLPPIDYGFHIYLTERPLRVRLIRFSNALLSAITCCVSSTLRLVLALISAARLRAFCGRFLRRSDYVCSGFRIQFRKGFVEPRVLFSPCVFGCHVHNASKFHGFSSRAAAACRGLLRRSPKACASFAFRGVPCTEYRFNSCRTVKNPPLDVARGAEAFAPLPSLSNLADADVASTATRHRVLFQSVFSSSDRSEWSKRVVADRSTWNMEIYRWNLKTRLIT